MAEKTTYSPGQVSEMLGLPPSTLRRYCEIYRDSLSEFAQRRGKKRRYTDTDILILRRIRQLTAQRKTPQDIARLLLVVDNSEDQSSTLAIIPQIAAEFESLRSQLASLRADQTTEMQRIQDRLDNLEKIVTTQRRSFWDRLFGR